MLARSFTRASRSFVRPATAVRPLSWWSHVEMGPKDPILGVSEAFKADKDPQKLNLGVGAYRDDDGKPYPLPSVIEAEQRIAKAGLDHEYLPIGGSPNFVNLSLKLAFGEDADLSTRSAVQSLSGTGALRILAEFLARQWNADSPPTVYLPNPTWGNHFPIFQHAGLKTETYRYYNAETKGLWLSGMLEDIKAAPRGSVFLLHAAAHNPTGVDPKAGEWDQISAACKEQGHFVAFDMAYQGFASGDCEKDVQAVRKFVADGHSVALCQSFAKNFGLYGQRAGVFSIQTDSLEEKAKVDSQLKIICRPIYSNPPLHGARIVETILSDAELKQQWLGEVKSMADRIIDMRTALYDGLVTKNGSALNWDHVNDQIGMFCFSGLSPEQVDKLTADWHIYLTRNGRISMAGVTTKNVDYLAEAIHSITK